MYLFFFLLLGFEARRPHVGSVARSARPYLLLIIIMQLF